jgi:hypothetical protein
MFDFETPGADGADSDKWRWPAAPQVGFRWASQVVQFSLAVFKSVSVKFVKLEIIELWKFMQFCSKY